MVPSTVVIPRVGSFALALPGRIRKVQELSFAASAGSKSFALKRIFEVVLVIAAPRTIIALWWSNVRVRLRPPHTIVTDAPMRELIRRFIAMRRNHPAWLLLASPKGPLMLASLKTLSEARPSGVDFEDAVEQLASVFADNANDNEFDLDDDHPLAARRELRLWLKRGLIVERNGLVLATDALQRSLQFLDLIEDNTMTSTASRLATVQRAIETLEAQLNRNQEERERSLTAKIDSLKKELTAVQSGKFEVLEGPKAEEGIREVYQLAISLHADFRRVEDSYREADRSLRQRIISERQNRGQIVDELLSGHKALIETSEGQVFESFYAQLVKTTEIEEMKRRLGSILANDNANRALERKQKADLGRLVPRMLQESERVIQARAKSERDVRGFLKCGLADEHVRVGALLQEVFRTAMEVDWQSQKVRRLPAPLHALALSAGNLPLPERLLVKQIDQVNGDELNLTVSEADLAELDNEFWQAYRALNRAELFETTLAHLQGSGERLTIGGLAKALPPTHDLETLAYWLAMARQAGLEIDERTETVDLQNDAADWTRFHVPAVELGYEAVKDLESGGIE